MTNWDELRRDLQSINGLRVSQVRAIRDIINEHKAKERPVADGDEFAVAFAILSMLAGYDGTGSANAAIEMIEREVERLRAMEKRAETCAGRQAAVTVRQIPGDR